MGKCPLRYLYMSSVQCLRPNLNLDRLDTWTRVGDRVGSTSCLSRVSRPPGTEWESPRDRVTTL